MNRKTQARRDQYYHEVVPLLNEGKLFYDDRHPNRAFVGMNDMEAKIAEMSIAGLPAEEVATRLELPRKAVDAALKSPLVFAAVKAGQQALQLAAEREARYQLLIAGPVAGVQDLQRATTRVMMDAIAASADAEPGSREQIGSQVVALKAAELLGRSLGAFVERVESRNVTMDVTSLVQELTERELRARGHREEDAA